MLYNQDPLFENPLLDPLLNHPGGRMSVVGQPLHRINIPDIKTLISTTGDNKGILSSVDVGDTLTKAGITPNQPITISDESTGIVLNINLLGLNTSVNGLSEIPIGQTVGKPIPRDIHEAKNYLHMITSQRSGSKNISFDNQELKKIARNLDLETTGNKDVLAAKIRKKIIEFHNIQGVV